MEFRVVTINYIEVIESSDEYFDQKAIAENGLTLKRTINKKL